MRRRTGLRGRVGTVTALGLLKRWGHPLTYFYIFIFTTGDRTAFLCICQPFRENTADKMPTTLLLPKTNSSKTQPWQGKLPQDTSRPHGQDSRAAAAAGTVTRDRAARLAQFSLRADQPAGRERESEGRGEAR